MPYYSQSAAVQTAPGACATFGLALPTTFFVAAATFVTVTVTGTGTVIVNPMLSSQPRTAYTPAHTATSESSHSIAHRSVPDSVTPQSQAPRTAR